MENRTPWIVCSGCVLSLGLIAHLRAQPVPVGLAEPLELPAHIVRGQLDLPAPESWQYARIDGFEVLSNAPQREANRLLKDFQRFRQAIALINPSAVPPVAVSSLIICGGGGRFRDFTANRQRDYNGTISLFLHNREQTAIVVDFETKALNLQGLAMIKPNGDTYDELTIEHDRQLIRQYVRFLLTRTDFLPPPWVVEGLTQIIMDIEVSERDIKLGRLDITKGAPVAVGGGLIGGETPRAMDAGSMIVALSDPDSRKAPDPNIAVGDRPFNVVLAHSPLLPWEKFFALTAGAPEVDNSTGDCLWAKQAYAFVHFCLFRADGKYREAYATFVRRLANEPFSEALFSQCFQMSYKELTREMRAYIAHPRHVFRHIKLTDEGKLAADFKFREATQSEVGRIKGDAQRLAGRHRDALLTYRVAYARGERDAALLAALGIGEHEAGEADRAGRFLETAAKLGTDRPAAYVALARHRLDFARLQPASEGRLSPAQTAAVLEPALRARALQPALPETYAVMAEAWTLSAVPPTPANVHVIGEGVMKFPFDSGLALRAAQLYARAGDIKSAAEVARMGLRFAEDAADRARFNEFIGTLPQSAPPGSPPAGGNSGSSTS